ncbi:nucleotidyltransferase domain-containing protein [Elizabethkingia occulta]|uniref:nucleotidyltransferase domain-containing protein n=1 Tax=Elizabethkingia occulta TaxID=1867263 RepID=UPI000999EDB1|nr:nucleotidyltransferase [Elizabethkingia occulta]OPB97930.1 hypothetical protein BB020_13980 [Elizabethkingia occulta]
MKETLHEHLSNVLTTHKMTHIDELLSKYNTKRDEIRSALNEKYSNSIYSSFNSGSYAKHTAINSKFDLDIVVPYKKGAFSTLEEMFNDLYNFLDEKYKDVAEVRKQKVSIGVLFHEDEDGDVVNIDVVPGRELAADNYLESKDLNLFFNEGMGLFAKNSYLKTNIQNQIDHIKGKENERKIIRLLKIWKNSNNEKYKSFFLELATIKAFDKTDVSGSLWDKLKAVMEYIKDNVTKDDFNLKDPGNSNNNVSDSLDTWDKASLSSKMEMIIMNIEDNNENIKTYFPVNEEFVVEENSEKNTYGLKSSIITPSIPSNNQRFG